MTERPELWLGDLARAIDALAPRDERTRAAIAEQLGLALRAPRSKVPEASEAVVPERADVSPGEAPPARTPVQASVDGETGAAGEAALPELMPSSTTRSASLEGWAEVPPLERYSRAKHDGRIDRHRPLLDPRWSREVLASLLATVRHDGPVDAAAVVDIVACGRPVGPVPRLKRRSLARGAQLLVDVGAGMQPFTRDVWELVDQIERLVGPANVVTLMFSDAPARGAGDGPVWDWQPYAPPERGSPVLVVTDLGIGGPRGRRERSRQSEWLDLAARLATTESALFALVPYPCDRWDPRLAAAMTIVEWDRTTTVSKVHARRGGSA